MAGIVLREAPRPADLEGVRAIVTSTGFFRPDEIDVAVELVQERLGRGAASGYEFLFADREGASLGYACFGPIACTLGSYDLYWIAIDERWRGQGIGRWLLREAEARIAASGGRRVYIETSSQPRYEPTRGFYSGAGYALEARLAEFYAPGDDKLVYVRAV
ncbi:MAG: GNAT family N-acetyltransferase [Proteobacteria bacterium]|nr:GNAT family N-acetyltransferase [Pseudomonadota bacterium]